MNKSMQISGHKNKNHINRNTKTPADEYHLKSSKAVIIEENYQWSRSFSFSSIRLFEKLSVLMLRRK